MTRVLIVRAGALGDLLLLRRTIVALQRAGRAVALLAPSGPAAALIGPGAGVIGYIEQSSIPEAIAPSAIASFPFITTTSPGRDSCGISTRNGMCAAAQS